MAGYGNNSDADAYHTARGNIAWIAADEPEKDAARLIASDWIDSHYDGLFPGYRTGKLVQARAWPRELAYDSFGDYIPNDVIPVQVENAAYEVALRQIVAPGSLFVDWTPGKDKRSVAVVGAVSVTYAGSMSYSDAQLNIGGIDAILAPVLTNDGMSSMYSGRSGRV